MKRIQIYNDLNKVYRFTIEVVLEPDLPIAAGEILPLQDEKGKYDELALDYYSDFINDVIALFDAHGFAIIEERKSPYSYSEYFTLVKEEDIKKHDYEFILFIRLSDHDNRIATRQGTKRFYSDKAQSLKEPKDKKRQTWKLKEITVNKDRFSTYEEALADVDKRLSQYD